MKLNHLNLVVADVPALSTLLVSCFGFSQRMMHSGGGMAILDGADGMILVLMGAAFNRNGSGVDYPDAFHIGFMQASRAAVDALHQRLAASGIALPQAPGRIRDSYGFYFHVDTLLIEIGCYETE